MQKDTTKLSLKLRMIFMLFILIASAATSFVVPSKPARALTITEEIANDDKRRDLEAMEECTSISVIDTDDDVTSFSDMFHDKRWAGADQNGWDVEIAVTGFGRDSSNGVVSCEKAIKRGLEILGKPSSVLEAFTDGDYTDYREAIPASAFANYIEALNDDIDTAKNAIPQPTNDYVYQRRFFNTASNRSLGEACFRIETSATSTQGDRDFEIILESDGNKEIFFYYRGDQKMRKIIDTDEGGWINDDGTGGRPTRIGGIEVSEGIANWNSWTRKTFPVGWGYDKIEDGATYGPSGFVTCKFAKDNKDWLFGKNVKFSNGKLILTADAITDDENQDVIDQAVQDKIDAINQAISNNPNGDNIFAFCTASVIQKYAEYPDIAALDGDLSAIKDYVIAWLAAFRTDGADIPTVPWSNDESLQIIACLTSPDAFGSAFGDLLDLQPEDLQEIEDIQTEEDPEAAPEEVQNCKGGSGVLDGFLGFILCPIAEAFLRTIDWAQNTLIIPFLGVRPLTTEVDDPVYEMWQIVRNIAYVFLIVGFMYLIYAETTSFGGEAYQLKRMAPRLVMVTIGIGLSYYGVGLIVDFFNILGTGIAELTKTLLDLQALPDQTLVTTSFPAVALVGTIGTAALIGGVLSGSISIGPIILVALAGIAVVVAVVVTLFLRQALILMLIVTAPLAISASLLPNTEKFFKTWWSLLSKALVMYPIIMLLFSGGKVLSTLITSDQFIAGGGAGTGIIRSLMGFVANIAPLFLVPFAFKMAGGAIGGVWGAMRGGISKGRNAAMGSEHNPNSIRGRAAAKGARRTDAWLRRKNDWNERLSEKGKRGGGARMAGLINRATRLDERAREAEEKLQKMGQSAFGEEGGEGWKDEIASGLDVNAQDLAKRGHLKAGDVQAAAVYDRAATGERTARTAGRRKDVAHAINSFKNAGYNHKGSEAAALASADLLARRVERGDFSAESADKIWDAYQVQAMSHGNATIKEMTWRTGENSADGKSTLQDNLAKAREAVPDAVNGGLSGGKGLGKILNKIDTKPSPASMTTSDMESATIAARDHYGSLSDKQKSTLTGLAEHMIISEQWNSSMANDQVRARDEFLAAMPKDVVDRIRAARAGGRTSASSTDPSVAGVTPPPSSGPGGPAGPAPPASGPGG